MPEHVLSRVRDKDLKDMSKVGLYGLTYKENVDDTRESPTLQLLEKLDEQLIFAVKVYDPLIQEEIVDNQFKENIDLVKDKYILDTKNISDNVGVYKL